MTKKEIDLIGAMNMCDEISNEAYKKIMVHCTDEEAQPCDNCEKVREAYTNGFDYGVKDWFAAKTQPCEDAVSRAEVEKFMYRVRSDKYGEIFRRKDLQEYFNSLPSVQPERAKDIPKPITIENGFVKCGECGKYIRLPIADYYSYCPECGQRIAWIEDTRGEQK